MYIDTWAEKVNLVILNLCLGITGQLSKETPFITAEIHTLVSEVHVKIANLKISTTQFEAECCGTMVVYGAANQSVVQVNDGCQLPHGRRELGKERGNMPVVTGNYGLGVLLRHFPNAPLPRKIFHSLDSTMSTE
jgi:hypothetical protein